ncbi:MAG: hypothetical protein ACK504_00840 [Bacteroidota bacterium]
MITKKNLKSLVILNFILLMLSCGDGKQDNIEVEEDIKTTNNLDSHKISAQNVFNSLPGRLEIISLTEKARAVYNAKTLNDPQNSKKYILESNTALNLGIYGADLYVTGVYEQTQESFIFLEAVNVLARNLGVGSIFDEAVVSRMETNKNNRDSTMNIIIQSFLKIDNFLTENGRPGTSSLVVAGCWIESIYIACKTAHETQSERIVSEIFAQKKSLKYVIDLLQKSEISQDSKFVLKDLSYLKALLDSKTDSKYSLSSIKVIDQKISELRTAIVKKNS